MNRLCPASDKVSQRKAGAVLNMAQDRIGGQKTHLSLPFPECRNYCFPFRCPVSSPPMGFWPFVWGILLEGEWPDNSFDQGGNKYAVEF